MRGTTTAHVLEYPPPLALSPQGGRGNDAGDRRSVSRTAPLIAFCGLLLSVSAFSCDITLPAFWSMQQDLGAPIEWVQAVVPVFLIFQATGSSFSGPCPTATAAGR